MKERTKKGWMDKLEKLKEGKRSKQRNRQRGKSNTQTGGTWSTLRETLVVDPRDVPSKRFAVIHQR